MRRQHSARAVPLVPPYRAAERRNAVSNCGTEQRNDSGTPDLEALINQVLSRSRAGTHPGTEAEREPILPFRTPRNAPEMSSRAVEALPLSLSYPVCPHVDDIELAYWYAKHPEVICARCWLERHGRPIQAEAPRRNSPTTPADGARNRGAGR
jgi:hypothetical protein